MIGIQLQKYNTKVILSLCVHIYSSIYVWNEDRRTEKEKREVKTDKSDEVRLENIDRLRNEKKKTRWMNKQNDGFMFCILHREISNIVMIFLFSFSLSLIATVTHLRHHFIFDLVWSTQHLHIINANFFVSVMPILSFTRFLLFFFLNQYIHSTFFAVKVSAQFYYSMV